MLNESKLVLMNFTSKSILEYQPLILKSNIILYTNAARYLDMNANAKLKWEDHIGKNEKN